MTKTPKRPALIDVQVPAVALDPWAEIQKVWHEVAARLNACVNPELIWTENPSDSFAGVSVMRILQAVSVAAVRGDAATLLKWERVTLAYMRANALDEYVRLALQPRAALDRHLVLDNLRARIATFIKGQRTALETERLSSEHVALTIIAWIGTAFPSLNKGTDDVVYCQAILKFVTERYERHLKNTKPGRDVDADVVLLDGLEAFGVPRSTGQNWLKGTPSSRR